MFQPFSDDENCRSIDEDRLNDIVSEQILEAFFRIQDLNSLLGNQAVVGIRLYPATANEGNLATPPPPDDSNHSLIAIGVDQNRSDIFTPGGSDYLLSRGKFTRPIGEMAAIPLSKSEAQNHCDQAQEKLTVDEGISDNRTRSGYFSVYFSRFSINKLKDTGCEGVRFYCHKIVDLPIETTIKPLTLTAVPVDVNNEPLIIETNVPGLESLAPCPPDCGDPGRYLNPYDIDLNKGVNHQPSTT